MTHRARHRRARSTPALVRSGAAVTLAASLLAAPAVPASATPGQSQGVAWGRSMHVASRATPTPQRPTTVDAEAVTATLRPHGGPASASAAAQTACAGCSGTAVTLQVLTSPGVGAIRATNTATAYTTGNGASSTAVSVQVIAAADAQGVIASNSALSVNEGCTGCSASTIAIQYIAVGGQELSPAARELVRQIEDALAAEINAAPPATRTARAAHARSASNDAAQRAHALIAADTGVAVETRLDLDAED